MKQRFLANKRKRLNTISETKPNTVHLTAFAARKPISGPAIIARLKFPDFAELAFVNFV